MLATAAVDALHRAGVQLHPFDFTRLEDLVVRFARELGPRAAAWAQMVRPASKASPPEFEPEIVNEDNIADVGNDARLGFLQMLRAGDSARARKLIEQLFTAQPATARADLIGVLRVGLGGDDLTFLEAARSDRAQSVRDRAAALLECIPRTESYATKLARLKDHLKLKTGLILRRKTLSVSGLDGQPAVLAALFDGPELEDISRKLGLGPREFCALAAEVPEIDAHVLKIVATERRFDLIPIFATCLSRNGGMIAAEILEHSLPFVPTAEREHLLRACIVPRAWTTMPNKWALDRLYSAWRGPLPQDLAEAILASPAWADALGKAREDATPILADTIEATAPLLPSRLSERFIGEIGAIAPRAAAFHRFILALPNSD